LDKESISMSVFKFENTVIKKHPSHKTSVAILDQFEHLDHVAQQDVRSLLAAASPYSTTNEVERRKTNICTLIF
jgi:hypothetical protein